MSPHSFLSASSLKLGARPDLSSPPPSLAGDAKPRSRVGTRARAGACPASRAAPLPAHAARGL